MHPYHDTDKTYDLRRMNCTILGTVDKREKLFKYLSTAEPGSLIKVETAQQTRDIKLLK